MNKQPDMAIYLRRVLAFALAVLLLCLAIKTLSHTHKQGQTEASCQICQAAHLRCLPGVVVEAEPDPLMPVEYVVPLVLSFDETIVPHNSSSRAPPTV